MNKIRIAKWLLFLLVAVSSPWIAHASGSIADAVSSGFELKDLAFSLNRLSSNWDKSPFFIGLAAFALIVAIATRGTKRR